MPYQMSRRPVGFSPSDRTNLIRMASTMPAGDPHRRALLRVLTAATRVNLEGISRGYREETRNLDMIGPPVSVDDWVDAMVAGQAEGYNAFDLRRVATWLKRFGIRKVLPARESSVALYVQVPSRLDIEAFADGARGAAVDEFSVHNSYGSPPIGGGYYTPGQESMAELVDVAKPGNLIRLWWD